MWIKSLAIILTMMGGGTNTLDCLNSTSPDTLSSVEVRADNDVVKLEEKNLLYTQEALSKDSAETTTPLLTWREAAPLSISATLITVGAIGVKNGWMCKTKRNLRNEIQGWNDGEKRFRADDYLQYLPLAVNIGLDFTGIKARHNFRERLAVSATATALHVGLTQGLKWCVDEERPNGRNANSFPSGHTSWSFMGAELIREEYGWAWGAGAYTFATGIAFLRLYNDEHWLNDILAGAGIGILSARVAYLLLPLERRLFRWDKTSHTTTCIPIYSPESKAVGLAFHVAF